MNRKRAMMKRKYFGCGGFKHITCNYRNKEIREELTQLLSNKFEVLINRVIEVRVSSRGKEKKARKTILREEREKKKKKPDSCFISTEGKEMIVKIESKQEGDEEGIVIEALLDSRATELVISSKFVKKNKFKKKILNRLIYVKDIDGTFNHKGPVKHTIKVKLFYREHKERMEIDIIKEQK